MAVTSREISDKAERASSQGRKDMHPRGRRTSPMWPLGIFALGVGAVLWPIGAMTTLDGWVQFLNIILVFLHLPFSVPHPDGWWRVGLAGVIGFVYSQAEVRVRVGLPAGLHLLPQWFLAVLLVLLVHSSDLLTTFLGYYFPPPDAWAIQRWMTADGLWFLVLWSIFLTYAPERSMILGDGWIGRPFGRMFDAIGGAWRHVWMTWARSSPRYNPGSGS